MEEDGLRVEMRKYKGGGRERGRRLRKQMEWDGV